MYNVDLLIKVSEFASQVYNTHVKHRTRDNLCSCKPVKGVTGQCNFLKSAQLHRSGPLTLNCLICQSGP